MKLFEYEAKHILSQKGVKIPRSVLIAPGDDPLAKMEEAGLKPPVVVKAQVLVAGRGKAGGIKMAKTEEDVKNIVNELFNKPIKGIVPKLLLIEEAIPHETELYAAIVLDRSERKPVILASKYGGMDIEEISREKPESIVRQHVDPFIGLKGYQARLIGKKIGLSGKALASFAKFLTALYEAFTEYDAELAESNPLALVGDEVIPLDARMIVDDNSLYRHPEIAKERLEESGEYTEWEIKARKMGLGFVELDGEIGIIGNGAGLTMTTMDLVYEFGGKPANFLDIGGGASAELVKKAVSFLIEYPKAKKIFINIFGGITRGDEVAKGIVKALEELGDVSKPIVIRLAGTKAEEGKKILEEAGIAAFTDPIEAVKKVIEM
ncbi:MAG: ADP-forming succinate--CoA ligase subunit beta [Desulfurococcales archaeon]|nr:ADP-forming succinate--CoA ligase subunit beta [Desulfurococcales archaeon]MCE4622645.1 ADP-forming succinate--CoA ligase subunit beta [Desulfurococcales archaeon]MCE4626422.1 ADP-forming succinate--CoA ligase subunit beta [Desulfurococcales archaeon]